MSKQFEEGLAAWNVFAEKGRPWDTKDEPKNPYPPGTAKHVKWENGWDEGMVRWEMCVELDA